jgi:copper homeostasis protein
MEAPHDFLIEAAVESVEAARAAAEGGAHRVELCTDLAHDGTTPDTGLLRTCISQLTIPVFVLVRPRVGDFVYQPGEHRTMQQQIQAAKAAGAQGIVTGALTASQQIAEDRTAQLIESARPLPVTFHRAFDACRDLPAALETLVALGVERVLTSGGAPTAIQGVERIAKLVRQSKGRITILAGGGINAGNVARVRDTGVREVHFSVKTPEKVREIIETLLAR